jgi:hypothetical protein
MEIKEFDSRIESYISSDVSVKTFEDISTDNKRGIIILGCGGQIKNWVEGVKKEVHKRNIFQDDNWIKEYFLIMTNGGRADLVFIFNEGIEMLRKFLFESPENINHTDTITH